MPTQFDDQFNGPAGQNLAAHVGDLNARWSKVSGSDITLTGDGRISVGATGGRYRALGSDSLASPVEVTIVAQFPFANTSIAGGIRIFTANNSALGGLGSITGLLWIDNDSSSETLFRTPVSGVSWSRPKSTASMTVTVKVTGSSYELWVDGSKVLTTNLDAGPSGPLDLNMSDGLGNQRVFVHSLTVSTATGYVAPPPAPPSPEPGLDDYFVLDTFSTDGRLDARAGEIGAEWGYKGGLFDSWTIPENGTVDDGRLRYAKVTQFNPYYMGVSSGECPVPAAYVEAWLSFDSANNWGKLEFGFVGLENTTASGRLAKGYVYFTTYPDDFHYGGVQVANDDGMMQKDLLWDVNDGNGFAAPTFDALHCYRLELTGTTIRLLIDGVQQFAFEHGQPIDAHNTRIYISSGGGMQLAEVRAAALTVGPTTPEPFWTLYQGTQEVLA